MSEAGSVPVGVDAMVSGLPPLDLRLLRRLRPGVNRLLRTVFHVHELGRELLPEGPAVLAVNHLSNLDGPLVVAMLPDTLALAKRELYHGGMGWFLDHVGQIPVDRTFSDPWAVKRCVQVLDSGRRLAIFPESHRGAGDFSHFKTGAAYLAMVTGAPVVPVALFGTRPDAGTVSSLPRRGADLHLVYGPPIAVQQVPWPRRPDAVAAETARLQQICRQHVIDAAARTGADLPH